MKTVANSRIFNLVYGTCVLDAFIKYTSMRGRYTYINTYSINAILLLQ